jgi:hypothetical protein
MTKRRKITLAVVGIPLLGLIALFFSLSFYRGECTLDAAIRLG